MNRIAHEDTGTGPRGAGARGRADPQPHALQLGLPVGLLLPLPEKRYAVELIRAVTFHKPIREGVLAASQFPPQLADANGTITKPSAW